MEVDQGIMSEKEGKVGSALYVDPIRHAVIFTAIGMAVTAIPSNKEIITASELTTVIDRIITEIFRDDALREQEKTLLVIPWAQRLIDLAAAFNQKQMKDVMKFFGF